MIPLRSKRAGGEFIAQADTPTPCVEFNEDYRGKPFLVNLDAANLEVVWNRDEQTIDANLQLSLKSLPNNWEFRGFS
jgi:hypothetical protein